MPIRHCDAYADTQPEGVGRYAINRQAGVESATTFRHPTAKSFTK
jgi:hypothetical protein